MIDRVLNWMFDYLIVPIGLALIPIILLLLLTSIGALIYTLFFLGVNCAGG